MENKTYQYKRITVKIGSNVLTRRDGTLDITRMSALVDQVAELHKAGKRYRSHIDFFRCRGQRERRAERGRLAQDGQRGPAAAFLGSRTG